MQNSAFPHLLLIQNVILTNFECEANFDKLASLCVTVMGVFHFPSPARDLKLETKIPVPTKACAVLPINYKTFHNKLGTKIKLGIFLNLFKALGLSWYI